MEKRKIYFFASAIIFLVFGSIIFQFASANTVGNLEYRGASEQIIKTLQDIFGPFLESVIGTGAFDEFFWAKILLLVLFYVIVFMVLQKAELFKDNRAVIVIVSAIVAILSVRFIRDNEFMRGLMLPYGVFAVVITILIPFLIFFLFIHKSGMTGAGRRVSWIFFLLVFIILWTSREGEISQEINTIYAAGILLIVLCAIFDRSIHKYFEWSGIKLSSNKGVERAIAHKQAELKELRSKGDLGSEETKRTIKNLEDEIKNLYKQRK